MNPNIDFLGICQLLKALQTVGFSENAINYLVFSYTENVFMNPTTHKELKKNDFFMDMCRKSTDFRSHTPFPLDDPLEAAVKEFSLSKRNEIPNLLSREYALN